jgi:hypothetical protein
MKMPQCLDLELPSSVQEINYSYLGTKSANFTNGTLEKCLASNQSVEYLISGFNGDIFDQRNVKFTYDIDQMFYESVIGFVGPNIYQL